MIGAGIFVFNGFTTNSDNGAEMQGTHWNLRRELSA